MDTVLLNTLALMLAGCINLAAYSATQVVFGIKQSQQKQKESRQ